MADITRTCVHCRSQLKKWRVPDGTAWTEEYFLVCFDDDCSYYREGWEWMETQYSQKTSYRFMVNPSTGCPSMLPVWSDDATREMIIEHEGGVVQ